MPLALRAHPPWRASQEAHPWCMSEMLARGLGGHRLCPSTFPDVNLNQGRVRLHNAAYSWFITKRRIPLTLSRHGGKICGLDGTCSLRFRFKWMTYNLLPKPKTCVIYQFLQKLAFLR